MLSVSSKRFIYSGLDGLLSMSCFQPLIELLVQTVSGDRFGRKGGTVSFVRRIISSIGMV